MVDNYSLLTLKKEVPFRGWTEIAEYDASTASGLVESESCACEHRIYRPGVGETVGARYKVWLAWYLSETDCPLCWNSWQYCWGICVERGWSTLTSAETL